MSILIPAAVWALSTVTVVGALWLASRKPMPAPSLPASSSHNPRTCEVCLWASDVGVIVAIDWALWSSEMERTS